MFTTILPLATILKLDYNQSMSKTKRDIWKMRDADLQEWLKINKPKTIRSKKVYKRKPKYPSY